MSYTTFLFSFAILFIEIFTGTHNILASQNMVSNRVVQSLQNSDFDHHLSKTKVAALNELMKRPRGKWDNRTGKLKGIRVLAYTKNGEGFVHKTIADGVNALEKLADEHKFHLDVSDDPSVFNDHNLRKYHAIIFVNNNNDVFDTDNQRIALMRYVQSGGGFVGIHIAIGVERNWSWYKQMIGGTFDRHPPFQEFKVKVFDASHPSVQHMPDIWTIKDEPYYVKEYNPGVRVLMVHDLSTINDKKDKPEIFGNNYPSVWCNTFDGGRQWFTSYGHDAYIYTDEIFLQHILGGIKWVIADGLPDYRKAYVTTLDK